MNKITNEWSEPLKIKNFPWDNCGYRPDTDVYLKYDSKALYVRFIVNYESDIRAVLKNSNEQVCTDSCVEFFVNFMPEFKDEYLNFEINPLGTLLLGYGAGRENRLEISDIKDMNIKVQKNSETSWQVEYEISLNEINKHYTDFQFEKGSLIACNFYKCGDLCEIPHYGCWYPVKTPVPDFHRPEFFGSLILG